MDNFLEDIKRFQIDNSPDTNLLSNIIKESKGIDQIERFNLFETIDHIFKDFFNLKFYPVAISIACAGFLIGAVFSNNLINIKSQNSDNTNYSISNFYADGGII